MLKNWLHKRLRLKKSEATVEGEDGGANAVTADAGGIKPPIFTQNLYPPASNSHLMLIAFNRLLIY